MNNTEPRVRLEDVSLRLTLWTKLQSIFFAYAATVVILIAPYRVVVELLAIESLPAVGRMFAGGLLGAAILLWLLCIHSGWQVLTRRYVEDGIVEKGWRGARLIPWSRVRQATLYRHRGSTLIGLKLDNGRKYNIYLSYYRSARTLYAAIDHRLPVLIADPQNLAAALRDY